MTQPWEHIMEDRWAAQEAVKVLYAALSLAPPRMAWCESPKGLFLATRRLRSVQHQTAQALVTSIIPPGTDGVEYKANVSLLTAMIDPDLVVQSGGLMIQSFQSVFGRADRFDPILRQLRALFRFKATDPSGSWAPAQFAEQCMWPADYSTFDVPRLRPLQTQALLLIPFAKICWFCRPPTILRTDGGQLWCEDGPVAAWSDGFTVYRNKELEGEAPVTSEMNGARELVQAETRALPEATE